VTWKSGRCCDDTGTLDIQILEGLLSGTEAGRECFDVIQGEHHWRRGQRTKRIICINITVTKEPGAKIFKA
jgi:hypothetical protein